MLVTGLSSLVQPECQRITLYLLERNRLPLYSVRFLGHCNNAAYITIQFLLWYLSQCLSLHSWCRPRTCKYFHTHLPSIFLAHSAALWCSVFESKPFPSSQRPAAGRKHLQPRDTTQTHCELGRFASIFTFSFLNNIHKSQISTQQLAQVAWVTKSRLHEQAPQKPIRKCNLKSNSTAAKGQVLSQVRRVVTRTRMKHKS